MLKLIMIFIGGGLGAFLRYLTGESVILIFPNHFPNTFPISTLIVNVVGCLLYGVCGAFLKSHHPNWLSAFLLIGLLGGYTTFSTYMADNIGLMELNRISWMFMNIVLQSLLGFAAFLIGRWAVS